MTGAREKRPGCMEPMARSRLLARQAIVQLVFQDRLAQAFRIMQRRRGPELLLPSIICDIARASADT
eukprot:1524195-Pyramimonas_sp.AAC.1